MHVRLMYPNEYLCAADLHGKDVKLTISELSEEVLQRVDGTSDKKWIVYFAEMAEREGTDKKRLVLNKTNATTIASIYGSENADWIGKSITLYPTHTPSFGEVVECIRIRSQLREARVPD